MREFVEANMVYILMFLIFLVWLRTVLIIKDLKRLQSTIKNAVEKLKLPERRI